MFIDHITLFIAKHKMSHNNVWRKEWKISNMVDGLLMHDNDLTIVTNVIKKIINESPIKPTFTEDIIVEKFLPNW